MRPLRILIAAALLAGTPAAHATEDDDSAMFGQALALAQVFVHLAARSADPKEQDRAIDDILAGRNADANRAAAGLIAEISRDLPPEQQAVVAAIARDLVSIARRDRARGGVPHARGALRARQDLHAMGLVYHDERQFLDAVRRNDALAVELYVLGRGVNLGARDAQGRSALEIARAAGNERIAGLLGAAR